MKIISWNCNGGFRKKLYKFKDLNPDILIIQECENPEFYPKYFNDDFYSNFIWEGENKNKGIGIFYKSHVAIEKLNWDGDYNFVYPEFPNVNISWKSKDLKLFLPFSINKKFNFLAVWTKGKDNQVFGYLGQFWKYLLIHNKKFIEKPTLIIGDFNSNSIWDKIDRWWNHSNVINLLKSINLKSVYHEIFSEEQGLESRPTFFLNRNLEKPYHIDYAFITDSYMERVKFKLGKSENWIDVSDHLPLLLTLEENIFL